MKEDRGVGTERVKCVSVSATRRQGKASFWWVVREREGVKNPTAGASGPSGIWHLSFGQPT